MAALITMIVLAGVIVAVVALCGSGTITMNRGIGIRIPATRSSEAAWRAGHRAAYVPVIVGATVTVIVAGLGIALPQFTATATWISVILLVATLIWAVIRANTAGMAVAAEDHKAP